MRLGSRMEIYCSAAVTLVTKLERMVVGIRLFADLANFRI